MDLVVNVEHVTININLINKICVSFVPKALIIAQITQNQMDKLIVGVINVK